MGSHSRCSPHRCPQHSAREFTSISACAAQLTSPSPSAVANPTDLVKGLSASPHTTSLRQTLKIAPTAQCACRRTTLLDRHTTPHDMPLRASGVRVGCARCIVGQTRRRSAASCFRCLRSARTISSSRLSSGAALCRKVSRCISQRACLPGLSAQSRLIPSVRVPPSFRVIRLKHACVDVVKVRVMNDKDRRFRSVLDCVRIMLRQEGPMAFYKGFSMCWARVHFTPCALKV